MKEHPRAIRSLRLSGLALGGALLLAGAPALAQSFPEDARWIPLSRGGVPIGDPIGDAGKASDLVGSPAVPASFVYVDPDFLYFRLRVSEPALASPPAGFEPLAWTCLVDTDGDPSGYELAIGINGRAGPPAVELWRNLVQASQDDPADPAELLAGRAPAELYARQVIADSANDAGPDYFVDFAMDRAAIFAAATFQGPARFLCGTSFDVNALNGDLPKVEEPRLSNLFGDYLVCDQEGCSESTCPGAGQTCWVGLGACAAMGVTVCGPDGQAVCDAVAGKPSDELCDGVDNDCDGQIDDGFDLGAACTSGLGACEQPGVLVCGREGGVVCSGVPGAASEEICDGVDNDCDGEIDEGFDVGAACTEGLGACAATGTIVCGTNGRALCTAVPGVPAPEQCDGIDNDCGGVADDSMRVGSACTAGVGACTAQGVVVCMASGIARCDAVPGQAVAELCDGIDNDCDGVVDNGFDVGQTCTVGVGACAAEGAIACAGPGFAFCTAAPGQAVAELCDGIDNDCDGVVDNGFDVGQPCGVGIGACFALGEIQCGADGVPQCSAIPGVPEKETCDGIDNDCNGIADDHLHFGATCSTGVGACTRGGHELCSPSGTVVCDAEPGDPAPEVCNGVDDDCDGVVDEGCPPPESGCQSDADCGGAHSGVVCDADSHVCRTGCRAVGNGCPEGQECTSMSLDVGMCVASSKCQSDQECGEGRVCDLFTSKCVEGCRTDAGCGAPLSTMICDPETHTCVDGCVSDADCGAVGSGRVCDAASRRCVDGCHIDPDCGEATGRICDAATHLCAQGCRSDADCPEHLGCVIASGDTGVCSFELVPIVDEQPSCAVSEGSKSRDMTAYLLLAMASLALVRRRSSSSK